MNLSSITPLGLSKYHLLGFYLLTIALSANILGLPDLTRRIILKTSFPTTKLTHVDKISSTHYYCNFAFYGTAFANLVLEYVYFFEHPKINFIFLGVSVIIGLTLFTIKPLTSPVLYLAVIFLSTSSFFVFRSFLSIQELWPSHTEVINDIIGAATEISILVPYLWLISMKYLSRSNNISYIISTYTIIYAGYMVFQVFLVPNDHFDNYITPELRNEIDKEPVLEVVLINYICRRSIIKKFSDKTSLLMFDNVTLLDNHSIVEKFIDPLYWLMCLTMAIVIFTKFHIALTFRLTLDYLAGNSIFYQKVINFLSELLNIFLGFSFFPTLILTHVAERTSCCLLTFICSISTTLAMLCYSIPLIIPQIFTIIFIWLSSTLIYNYLFIATQDYFGGSFVAISQLISGTLSSIFGIMYPSIMTFFNEPFISRLSPDGQLVMWPTIKIFSIQIHTMYIVNICFTIMASFTILVAYYEYSLIVTKKKKLLDEHSQSLVKSKSFAIPIAHNE